MRRNQLRTLIGGLSFTTALFVFQACYGMPQDMQDDVLIRGKVASLTSGQPVKGIKVESDLYEHFGISDCQGNGFHNWYGDKSKPLVCKAFKRRINYPFAHYFNAASAFFSRCMAFSRFSSELA